MSGNDRFVRARAYCNNYMIGLVTFTVVCLVVVYTLRETIDDPWPDYAFREDGSEDARVVNPRSLEAFQLSGNIAFLTTGLYAWLIALYDMRRGASSTFPIGFVARPYWTVSLGVALMTVGIGSFMHHASGGQSDLGRHLDFMEFTSFVGS